MRPIIIMALALVLIIAFGYISYSYVLSSSDLVNKELVKVDNDVRVKNWNSAYQAVSNLDVKWNSIKNTWALLEDHQEIDNIELAISKMKEYVKGKNSTDALAEIASLKLLFTHIPEKESVNLKNIL